MSLPCLVISLSSNSGRFFQRLLSSSGLLSFSPFFLFLLFFANTLFGTSVYRRMFFFKRLLRIRAPRLRPKVFQRISFFPIGIPAFTGCPGPIENISHPSYCPHSLSPVSGAARFSVLPSTFPPSSTPCVFRGCFNFPFPKFTSSSRASLFFGFALPTVRSRIFSTLWT